MNTLTWIAEKRNVKDLKALDKNPRKITKAAIAKMKDRIGKRGFHDVLKLDTDGVVLSGNVRTEALIALDIKEVNVLVPSRKLTAEERDGVILESNRHDGEWDMEMLPEFGQEVLLDVGFQNSEVDQLMGESEDEEDFFDSDKTLKSIKKAEIKYGDLFKLGECRLICGDSTKSEDIKKLMDGKQADMVFCDPPYNVNYEGATHGSIMNDHMSEESFIEFCEKFVGSMKESTKAGAPYYICSGFSSFPAFLYALRVHDFKFSTTIIWVKNNTTFGFADYKRQHEVIVKTVAPKKTKKKAEPILYGWNQGKHYFPEMKFESDVWDIKRVASALMQHPTQKPIALINKAIKNSSKHNDIVLDLFGGSGATMIAAVKTGRRAYLCELDPKYCDVIIKRWEKLVGQTAVKL